MLAAEAGEPPIRPESLLPFRVSKEDANQRFGAWLGTLWLRPNDLKRIAKVQEMGGVYVPFWTFTSDVESSWVAERGWHYYETEVYFETINGQQVERTRQVQRTRWESASGYRGDHFSDVLVCAGRALPPELVDKLSAFDTKQLVAYRPEFLAGWRAESYTVELAPAFETAQQKMSRVQEGRCGGDVGGDTHRGVLVQNQFLRPTFKHVLLPVWIAAYRYNGKVYRFVVNGQSGEVVGIAPWSFWKIASLVVVLAAILGAIIAVVANQQNDRARAARDPFGHRDRAAHRGAVSAPHGGAPPSAPSGAAGTGAPSREHTPHPTHSPPHPSSTH